MMRRFMSTAAKVAATDAPPHIKAIVDEISRLKFHEINLLNDALKRELKIPDLATRPMMAGAQPAGQSDEAQDGQASGAKAQFTVKLVKFDDTKKVALIKEIKKLIEGINLVEAKRFVEDCPKVLKSNLTKDEAEELKKQIEAAGGQIKLE